MKKRVDTGDELKKRIKDLEKQNETLREKLGAFNNSTGNLGGDRVLNQLIATLPDVIWTMDLNLNYTYLSPSTERVFGYSLEDREQIIFHEIFPAESIQRFKALLTRQLQLAKENPKVDTSVSIESQATHKNGYQIWVEINADFTRDDNLQITGIQGVTRDITDRKEVLESLKKTERILKESEQNLKIITENSNDLIARFSPSGIFLYVSPSIKKLMGYSVEEFKNRYFLDGVFEEDQENVKIYFNKLINGQTNGETNISRFYKKDGSLIWLETSATLVYDDQDKLKDIVTIGRDVTDRINEELEFKKLYTRYETIAENFPNGAIFLFDKNIKYTMVAGEALTSTGISVEECIGKRVDEVFPECVHQVALPNSKKIFEGKTVYYEVMFQNMHFGNWGVPVKDRDGNIQEGLVFAVNITELKNNEQELIAAKDKAEESDRLKSAFLANMSHEIRTPMNGIIGFSEMLTKPDLTNEKRARYAKIIQESSKQLLHIVNDVLDISKLETGKIKISTEPVVIDDLIMELYTFYNPKSIDQNLEFVPRLDTRPEPLIIQSDPVKLKQILSNLLSNAFKFTSAGSIRFGYQIQKNNIQFFVEDTGIGIPKEMHEVIFERFRQLDYKSERYYGGTGLGLAICKKLVELLHGEMWVESVPGKGTTFYFSLPYSESEINVNTGKNDEPEIVDIPGQQTILIAEDEVINFIYLNELLVDQNLVSLHAKNGKQAVELCKEHPEIKLVLMDIKMPEMNGFEATNIIKSFRPDLPVIAQTAYAMSEDREKAITYGCNDYLSKPIDKSLLINILNKYLGSVK